MRLIKILGTHALIFLTCSYSEAQFGYELWPQGNCIVKISNDATTEILSGCNSTLDYGYFAIGNTLGELELLGDVRGVYDNNCSKIKESKGLHGYSCIAQDPSNPNLFHKFEASVNGSKSFVTHTKIDISLPEKIVNEDLLQEKNCSFIHIVPVSKDNFWVLFNTKGTQVVKAYKIIDGELQLINEYDAGRTFDYTFLLMRIFNNPSCSKIYYNQARGLLEMDFDANTGIISNFQTYSDIRNAIMSTCGKYIYAVDINKDGILTLKRYNPDNLSNDGQVVYTRSVTTDNDATCSGVTLGPDGNIYISRTTKYLDVVTDIETQSPTYHIDKINFESGTVGRFPNYFFYKTTHITESFSVCATHTKTYSVDSPEPNVIYHWTITGGTADKSTGDRITVKWQDTNGDGKITVYGEDPTTNCASETITYTVKIKNSPSATFDNAYVCHGQPLNIISSGDAPFEISYTIDGEPHNITTSDTEYQLPDVAGKYKITKIKDASCEFIPTENNDAEIAPQMKKVRIVEE